VTAAISAAMRARRPSRPAASTPSVVTMWTAPPVADAVGAWYSMVRRRASGDVGGTGRARTERDSPVRR